MENSCATIELPAFYVSGDVIHCHRTQVISSASSESTGVACTTAGSACNYPLAATQNHAPIAVSLGDRGISHALNHNSF
ncbi:MAG TPA: hypothetical protein V6D30_19490 [Leptolyngbyaceae cyanobacterium]